MTNEPHYTLNVDTDQPLARLQMSLQQLLDQLAVAMRGLQSGNESSTIQPFWNIAPAQDLRLSEDETIRDARLWLIRSCFRDSIEHANVFLDDVRIVAAFGELSQQRSITYGDYQQITGVDATRFHKLGFPEKLSQLEQQFALVSDFTPHVVSINKVRNCSVHRLGVVGDKDVDKEGQLTLRWNTMRLIGILPDRSEQEITEESPLIAAGTEVSMRLVDRAKTFPHGARVDLAYSDLVDTAATLIRFGAQITERVKQAYLRAAA